MTESAERWPALDLDQPRVAEGFRQMFEARRSAIAGGARPAGWKIAYNDPAVRRRLGLRGSAVGYLLDRTILDATRPFPLAGTQRPGAELELGFHLRGDVDPAADDDTVLAAIEAVSAAIELIDIDPSRSADLTWALAHNVWHRGAVLGPARPWSTDLLARISVAARHNGALAAGPLTGIDALADPAGAVRFAAGAVHALGERLHPGDVILSGLLAPEPLWLKPGDQLSADYALLGEISLSFA